MMRFKLRENARLWFPWFFAFSPRKQVVVVALVYGLVTWLVMQAINAAFPPKWASFIFLFVLVGLPITLTTVWEYAYAEKEAERRKTAPPEQPAAPAETSAAGTPDQPRGPVLDFLVRFFACCLRFLARCSRIWFPLLLYVGFLLPVIAGLYGHSYGLPHLFRDDAQLYSYGPWGALNSPAVWGHAAATLFLLAIWTGIFIREVIPKGGPELSRALMRYLVRNAGPFLPLQLIAAAIPGSGFFGISFEVMKALLGILIASGVAWVFTVALRLGRKHVWAPPERLANLKPAVRSTLVVVLFCDVVLAVTGFITIWDVIVPSVAVCTLLIWIATVHFLFGTIKPVSWRFPIAAGLIIWVFVVGDNPFANRFPGFTSASYENPRPVSELAAKTGLKSTAVLDSWYRFVTSRGNAGATCPAGVIEASASQSPAGADVNKPKLVVVAVSGGAYRAGYWSAQVLDQLVKLSAPCKALEGLASNIRILTGASGGMVASAYFSALAPDPRAGPDKSQGAWPVIENAIRADIGKSRTVEPFPTNVPIDRDGLGAMAQQMLQRDIVRYMVSPFAIGFRESGFNWERWQDRGLVLEQQWRSLALSFKELEAGERDGWRPSLIFSPMLIETGQPLLISNLDLSDIVITASRSQASASPAADSTAAKSTEQAATGATAEVPSTATAVEFFRWFPDMRERLKIQTAVRMNASFPYMSPAVSLPTNPQRRVVDAGYYDNYGTHLAVSWLSQLDVIQWLKEHTSGVILIQIRAFPAPPPEAEKGAIGGYALQWLTSPIEGMMAARSASMTFRNGQEVEEYSRNFEDGFVQTFLFENRALDKDIEMSWYVRCNALNTMNGELKRHKDEFTRLATHWGLGRDRDVGDIETSNACQFSPRQ